ncbi:MAG TPA: hypothetical protein VGQ57_07070 [Polyangiaceae bacterium]|jgi:hypothetical protein|nr:hypothetical protein [Polyangiaceae bacterium]
MSLSLETSRAPQPLSAVGHEPLRASEAPSAFTRFARGLARAIDRGEAVVERAASHRFDGMDAGTLIALQAGIYRYGEAVDLAAKLVDRATSAARTVLEGGR